MQINHCIILCGGRGTRLREFNLTDQKCLIHINSVPFIEYLLKQFSQYKITLCTGHLGEQVEDYYRDNKNIILSRENKPLGTGGAIINALGKIKDDTESSGDEICAFCDLNPFKNSCFILAMSSHHWISVTEQILLKFPSSEILKIDRL